MILSHGVLLALLACKLVFIILQLVLINCETLWRQNPKRCSSGGLERNCLKKQTMTAFCLNTKLGMLCERKDAIGVEQKNFEEVFRQILL